MLTSVPRLPVRDNRAIAQASAQAQWNGVPLIALHVLSPQDYIAHDRGARRIDFVLRNLQIIRVSPRQTYYVPEY